MSGNTGQTFQAYVACTTLLQKICFRRTGPEGAPVLFCCTGKGAACMQLFSYGKIIHFVKF
jgi:hypothetical protein